MKALFLVNPRAGKKRSVDLASVIRDACTFEHEIVSCGTKEELPSIIDRAEAANVDVVFAVGGDGTVHETAKALIGRAPALGILPTGSGNGFARHVGLPIDPAGAIASCNGGRIVTIDTALVNDHPFLGVMGIGFDATIADRFASSTTRGLETYIKEGLRAFADYKADEYEITVNGATARRSAFVIAVANSGQYGNNARIAPLASLRDGLLDVVVVDDTKIIDAAFLLMRLFSGTFHQAAGVTTLQTTELTIKRPTEGPAHLDGEPITLPAELHIRVVPQSLRLLVPDSATAL